MGADELWQTGLSERSLHSPTMSCRWLSATQYTMFKVIVQNHVIHDTSFREVWYAKHCFVYHWEYKNIKLIPRLGIFRHYGVFILGFFKQAVTKVFKVIMQLSFNL